METMVGRRAAWIVGLMSLVAAGMASAGQLWTEDAQEAMTRAATQKKDLLVLFTGSDWCPYCKKLDEEVLSQPAFKAEVRKHFVLLKLDFPKTREMPDETKKQNAQWTRKLKPNGYPTVVLTDATGKPYGRTGSWNPGKPEPYLKKLAELQQAHENPGADNPETGPAK